MPVTKDGLDGATRVENGRIGVEVDAVYWPFDICTAVQFLQESGHTCNDQDGDRITAAGFEGQFYLDTLPETLGLISVTVGRAAGAQEKFLNSWKTLPSHCKSMLSFTSVSIRWSTMAKKAYTMHWDGPSRTRRTLQPSGA